MKYFLLSFLLLGGCAIQGEVFRLQERMRAWNELLPQEQRVLFAQNDTNSVGVFLDAQEAADPAFAEKLRALRINEAVMPFDGVQTAHFFYNTLLKDLAKFSYAELIKNLTADEFLRFLSAPDGSGLAGNKKIEGVLANARSLYGMSDFTDADVLRYHRQKSLPSHLYIVVYDTLAFSARCGALSDVLNKRYDGISGFLETSRKNAQSRRPQTRKNAQTVLNDWDYILSRASVPRMPESAFLQIIVENILPEMDADVRTRTIENIAARFETPLTKE